MKKDVIIVGCGPSGLQLGYFLKSIKVDYIILEQNDIAGSFFKKFPHSGEMISINKRYTGSDNKEFNLRHDWNSLLNNHQIEMSKFSEDYYPKRDDLVRYLGEFGEYHKLNIEYNCKVNNIKKNANDYFVLECENNKEKKTYKCKKLVIATGLWKKNIPESIINIEEYGKHYSEYERDHFINRDTVNVYKNKNVLIVGYGNSAFEIADILNEYCASVVVMNRGNVSPRPAMCTHYVGDLRSKYMRFNDTFFLKSMNAIHEYEDKLLCILKRGDKYELNFIMDNNPVAYYTNILFDEIINCTGWKFDDSIFDKSIKIDMFIDEKYPEINGLYESNNVKDLYFIGALMHSVDYRKSSGSFIHGFRYLIDNFVKINFTNFGYKIIKNIDDLGLYFIKRINISSGLYQMHGQLCDIFYKTEDGYIYYEDIALSYVLSNKNKKIKLRGSVFILTLEYGNVISDIQVITRKFSSRGYENKSIFLHPVIRVINFDTVKDDKLDDIFYPSYNSFEELAVDTYHFDEELLTKYLNSNEYLNRFKKILNTYNVKE